MIMPDLYLGHPRELVDLAVVLPDANFVQLDDWLFDRHGLGPRYARVKTQLYHGHRAMSYAYLDLPGTTFELITEHEQPIDLGAFDDLATDERLVERLTATCIDRSDHFPTRQQLALALIRARVENVQADDELGAHRLVKWALAYERRAHWIATHRQQAFVKERIDWQALRL